MYISRAMSASSAHKRTSTHSSFRARCAERSSVDGNGCAPVRLVVFDYDETLTLVSYMIYPEDNASVRAQMVKVSFESPWVVGSRLKKLREMLKELAEGENGQRRVLAVLSRNKEQIAAVATMLDEAGLSEHISALWVLPYRAGRQNGAYRQGGSWVYFHPPVAAIADHKADVLHHLVQHPEAWFPQLKALAADAGEESPSSEAAALRALWQLTLESIVLVDDQRANFQSRTGMQVLRYCKVARYDAAYRNLGFLRNMGGLGAHCDADYATLKSFVEKPGSCRETFEVFCMERDFEGREAKRPVKLVVFDFDETLTLATFMPEDERFRIDLNFGASAAAAAVPGGPGCLEDLLRYNFESPHVDGCRRARLRELLGSLVEDSAGNRRTLAVLTQNASGVVAVLNLLRVAQLESHFSAIWSYPAREGRPSGVYQDADRTWRSFETPIATVNGHKADVLHDVVAHPERWFPQLDGADAADRAELGELRIEDVVLVDDERASFQSDQNGELRLLRHCKVARYDEVYRDCGLLNQMGGLGAHSDADYATLRAFVEEPWRFSEAVLDNGASLSGTDTNTEDDVAVSEIRRSDVSDELPKLPRIVSNPQLQQRHGQGCSLC